MYKSLFVIYYNIEMMIQYIFSNLLFWGKNVGGQEEHSQTNVTSKIRKKNKVCTTTNKCKHV